jgi:hypothetical protein
LAGAGIKARLRQSEEGPVFPVLPLAQQAIQIGGIGGMGQVSLKFPVFCVVEPVEHGLKQIFHVGGPFADLRHCEDNKLVSYSIISTMDFIR